MLVTAHRQGFVIGLLGALAWSRAWAQEPAAVDPAGVGTEGEPGSSAAEAPEQEAEEDSLEGYAPPSAEPAGEADDEADADVEAPTDELPPLPPPAAPRGSEQLPKPVPEARSAKPSRRVVLGVYAGAVHRSSQDDRVTYGTSFAYGPKAAVEIFPWLRTVAYARFEDIPVDARPGAFDTGEYRYPNTSIEQPALDSIGLGFRVEPTLVLNEQWRIMAAFDIAWNRFKAQAPATEGDTHVRSAERAGVGLNYKAGIGLAWEPIVHWLEVSALGEYGVFSSQDGTAFDDVLQGFDQSGYVVHLAPLPRFERSFELTLSVSVIL